MADWTAAMTQTFEYYTVDPGTWRDVRRVTTVTSSSIKRDLSSDTLGSATFDMTETLGEVYLRVYLVTVQNGIRDVSGADPRRRLQRYAPERLV